MIDMVEITQGYLPKVFPALYLVKTKKGRHPGMRNVKYMEARVNVVIKDGKEVMVIDVSNQTPTHISVDPLDFDSSKAIN